MVFRAARVRALEADLDFSSRRVTAFSEEQLEARSGMQRAEKLQLLDCSRRKAHSSSFLVTQLFLIGESNYCGELRTGAVKRANSAADLS